VTRRILTASLVTLTFLCGAILSPCPPVRADNWPQWRGPNNDGHSNETGLPAEFGPDKNVVWKLALPGVGSSTPCVWEDRIFVTYQVGAGEANLACVGTDGKLRWQQKIGSGEVRTRSGEGGNAATASPSTDGKLVFAFAGSGHLAAFDLDGKKVWENDLQKYGRFSIQFGCHWTPVLYKDRLYLQVLHRGAQVLVALDKNTGKEIWHVQRKSDGRGESPDVYASAFVWEKNGSALLISHGNDYCTAHSLDNGEEVWRVTELNPKARYNGAWRAVSSPLVTPDLIVIPTCKYHETVAIDPSLAKGEIAPGNPAEKWRFKKTPDVPSPLLVQGVVYLVSAGDGTLSALDAATGKLLYEGPRLTGHIVRASPLFADGKIYIVGRDGTIPVVRPGQKFELIARNQLPDKFTGSPAVSNGRIYLHGWNNLWAIGAR
jgi:outer membrane protein assembly factor BamB